MSPVQFSFWVMFDSWPGSQHTRLPCPSPTPMACSNSCPLSGWSHVQLFATPWTAAYQSPPSMGFSRQEYWSELPLPSPKKIFSPSHSIVFLYFFALISEEGFLISPCYSLELCIQMGIAFFFSFAFSFFFFFSAICKAFSDNHFPFLHFFFLEMVLIPASYTMSQTSVHSFSGTLSDLTWAFPSGSYGKESACSAADLGFNPWVGKIPWRRK